MTGQNLDGRLVLAGSAFALGVVTGLLLNRGAKKAGERMHAANAHRDYERTVAYDENLPDSLERREPAPYPGQPRFGGTGALGVHPAATATRRSGE